MLKLTHIKYLTSFCLLPRPLFLHRHSEGKSKLWIVVGVDTKLKAAAAGACDASAAAILALKVIN